MVQDLAANPQQRAPITTRFGTRHFSNLSALGTGSGHNNRKLSLLSEENSTNHLDDSFASNYSVTELLRRVSTMGASSSDSSATPTTLAARHSAGRIARNMSLYMRAGALPVAATVVDGQDGLESELRLQLEKEIRQELEIEMEEFRRQVVLQVVGAAEPVAAVSSFCLSESVSKSICDRSWSLCDSGSAPPETVMPTRPNPLRRSAVGARADHAVSWPFRLRPATRPC